MSFRLASAVLPNLASGVVSSQDAARISERARKRSERAKQRTEKREALKKEGNEFFKEGRYSEAVQKHEQAVHAGGKKPVLLANLAAAYLKLNLFEQAEEAATEALIYDPTNVKARYRRGLARKGLRRAIGASLDFEAVVQQEPRNTEVASELKIVRKITQDGKNSPSDDEYSDGEYIWPRCEEYEDNENGAESDSGSSDCEHTGNGVACRFYNHGGCTRKGGCQFSHAPDDKSVRDKLGRNVCTFAILGKCEFGEEKCIYSHDFRYLPEKGWWRNEEHRRELNEYVYMGRSLKPPRSEPYLVEMVHGFLYDEGYGPPRNLNTILDRGTLGHTIDNQSGERPATSSSPTPAPKDRFILIIALDNLDLFNSVHGHLVAALNAETKTQFASTAAAAHDHLSSPNLAGVFIADAGITQTKHDLKLSSPLAEYVKHGGLVVYGGAFSSFVKVPEMASYFNRVWNLPWKSGSYTRETLKLNKNQDTVALNPSLPASFSCKALFLKDVARDGSMYSSRYNDSESPVVHVKFGNGYLGYVGDVNGQEETTPVVLSMLGLLDHPYPLPSGPPSFSSTRPSPAKPPASFSRRFIMLLSLQNEDYFHEMYGQVYSALREKTRIKQALTSHAAFSFLGSPDLAGVFITDYGIAESQNASLLRKLVDYAKAGGLVVAAGQFSNHMTGARGFFQPWGFQWQKGSYHRTTFQKNPAVELVESNPSLPQTCNMKALHLTGLGQANAVYLPAPDSQVSSLVFPSTPVRNFEESPVVHAKVGKGWFGYIGDVNTEKESATILLAMLGLLDHKYEGSQSNPLLKEKDTIGRDGGKRTKPSNATRVETSGANASKTTTGPAVLVISMFEIPDIYEEEHQHLLKNLEDKTRLSHASTISSALDTLDSQAGLAGVFVNEPSIVVNTKYSGLLNKLISYVKGGGTVVFGGSFSSLAGPRVLDEFWEQQWGIKWRFGSYQQSLLTAEAGHQLLVKFPWLVKSFDTKAVHLRYRDSREVVYRDEEQVDQSAILRAKVGEGFVGYVGDVYGEAESTDVILAMLGQLQQP
ncbi:hypothetical protein PM082_020329 [Marasmius tenuissimus]|nr:hypothetical protein PM082_020329 [Marasmius tenuissimus]